VSTVIGTGVVAALQGALLGLAFAVAGLPNGLFWAVVTMAFAILPVVGSGMIWGPAAIVLIMQGRALAGVLLIVWGVLVVGSVDNFIRPLIYRRFFCDPSVDHADRRDRRRQLLRTAGLAHRPTRVELFLRADSDVS